RRRRHRRRQEEKTPHENGAAIDPPSTSSVLEGNKVGIKGRERETGDESTHNEPPRGLLPLTLDGKCGPVMGRLPSLILPHRNLRRSKRRRRSQPLSQHSLIESFHQLRCGPIIYPP